MPTPTSEIGITLETGAPALALSLFGPMQVLVEGQPLPPLRSRKSLWLLALLTLRHGRPVEREWLAGMLWPDAYQDRAAANLSPVLSDLRRALGSQTERLGSPSRHTLCLGLVGADVDVLAFDDAIVSKTPLSLEQAVALYRGPLLEGCPEEWAPQERSARELDFLQALQTLAETALRHGEHEKSADYYRRATGLDPWRDTAQRGLMDALAQNGDRNGAMQVYREFAALLRTDPRAVPDEETKALYTRLQSEARQQAVNPAHSPPTARQDDATSRTDTPIVTGYLPYPITTLVGREDEIGDIAARLKRSRLVTLSGPGGIGKTRLAVAVASQVVSDFAGGVWLVGLDALSHPQQVSRQIALVFGLQEESGRTALETVTEHLRRKRLLLVLDNCEHLLEESAAVAGHLLHECAGVRVLATSREALGVTGEVAWTVPALPVPDPAHLPAARATLLRVLMSYEGVQLFLERAQAVQKTFTLTAANARLVAQICFRLEGIPLALELAAARVKVMAIDQIAARLDDHLSLLTGGSRAAQPRQQTLRATLDWSYNLLSGPERLLLAQLSVFAGGWTLEAAERVCAAGEIAPGQVLDLLASLVEKSLVVFEGREKKNQESSQEKSEGRYRMLETVRQYAAESLNKSDASDQVKSKHRDWALALTRGAVSHLYGADQEEWLKRLDVEHDNLRAALAWAALDQAGASAGLNLANALSHFWRVRGYFSEGMSHFRRALEHKDAQADTAERARALNGLAMLATVNGDFVETRATYEQSIRIFQKLGDRKGTASALDGLGNAVYWLGEYAAAWAAYEESLAISRERGDQRCIAGTLHNMGAMAFAQGDFGRSQAIYEESLGILRQQNDRFSIAIALHSLGNLAYSQKKHTSARALYEEGMQIARDLGAKQLIAIMFEDFGDVDFSEKEYASAHSFYEESLSMHRELGDRRGIAASQQNLAKVAFSQGDAARAKALYRGSLVTFRELKYQEGVAKGLKGLAAVTQEQGQKSVHLFGAAEALREKIGTPIFPNERVQYDLPLSQARVSLGEAAFSSAWEEGRALTWEQAVDYALEEQQPLKRTVAF